MQKYIEISFSTLNFFVFLHPEYSYPNSEGICRGSDEEHSGGEVQYCRNKEQWPCSICKSNAFQPNLLFFSVLFPFYLNSFPVFHFLSLMGMSPILTNTMKIKINMWFDKVPPKQIKIHQEGKKAGHKQKEEKALQNKSKISKLKATRKIRPNNTEKKCDANRSTCGVKQMIRQRENGKWFAFV